MPKVVKKFIDNNRDSVKADEQKHDILELYRNDIEKVNVNYKTKIKAIFGQIPSFFQNTKNV